MSDSSQKYWKPDEEALEQLMHSFDVLAENDSDDNHVNVIPTRASIKRQFSHLSPENMLELTKTLDEFEDKFGITDTEIRYLSQNDIDTLVEELVTVRKLSDILVSREDVLKKFAKDVISKDQLEPDKTGGSLVSDKNHLKISKEIRGGKLSVDINLLKNRLTNAQFQSITNMITTTTTTVSPDGQFTQETTTTYEVNEKFLEAAIMRGEVYSEEIFLSSVESKRTIAIALRELGE